ncbi:MAG: DUF5668 domain-containing protein, partial [Bacteroidales bacterium]|nr:DUF5668 domain-containing protein [Bacteroidales bacterium]
MERIDPDFHTGHRHHHAACDHRRHMNNRRGWGILLILAGGVLFANAVGWFSEDVRHMLLSWQMLIIAIGVISMINNRSIVPGLFIVAVGAFFMINEFWEIAEVWRHAFWPIILLLFGVYLIIAPPRYLRHGNGTTQGPAQGGDNRDFIDEVAVFSGGDRIITSKNFKGGRIVSVFGGSDINLMNA